MYWISLITLLQGCRCFFVLKHKVEGTPKRCQGWGYSFWPFFHLSYHRVIQHLHCRHIPLSQTSKQRQLYINSFRSTIHDYGFCGNGGKTTPLSTCY